MDKATLFRVIIFVFAWLNNYLVSKGLQPLPVVDETIVAWFATFVVSVWTLWKNNDITKKARNRTALLKSVEKSVKENEKSA